MPENETRGNVSEGRDWGSVNVGFKKITFKIGYQ